MSEFGEHVAILKLDDRKRAPLGRFITREPVEQWRVYRAEDGKMILLEAVEA